MKMKKTLGAVMLSATLVLGTASFAFAAEPPGTVSDEFGASTNVLIATTGETVIDPEDPTEGQISVTVPLTMTIVAQAQGGDIVGPSSGAYKIVNGSTTEVKVTGGYTLEDSAMSIKLSDAAIEADAAATVGYDADLNLVLTPTDGSDAWTIGGTAPTWNILKSGILPMDVSGSTSVLAKTFDNASAAPLIMTLTYTVEGVQDAPDEP